MYIRISVLLSDLLHIPGRYEPGYNYPCSLQVFFYQRDSYLHHMHMYALTHHVASSDGVLDNCVRYGVCEYVGKYDENYLHASYNNPKHETIRQFKNTSFYGEQPYVWRLLR